MTTPKRRFPAGPSLELEGLVEAQRAFDRFGPDAQARKALNLTIMQQVLVPPVKQNVPKRSGALLDSIRANADKVHGYILAGYRTTVPYAAVIHFGWALRGIGGTRSRMQIRGAAEQSGALLGTRALNKATRRQRGEAMGAYRDENGQFTKHTYRTTQTTRRARGGPIKPNPFIYDAFSDHAKDVERRYEYDLLQRAKVEALL